jgi:hypothetical protein
MGSSSCSSTAVAGHGSAGLQQQQQQQHERKQQRGSESDTSCWSDPLSGVCACWTYGGVLMVYVSRCQHYGLHWALCV